MLQKNKKVCFYTELPFEGPVSRNHKNMRTDLSWICAFDAVNIPFNKIKIGEKFDLGILIIPKKIENMYSENLPSIWDDCKRIAVLQEGPHDYFMDYDVENQGLYLSALEKADFILCHNAYDKIFYEGMFPNKPVHVMRPLLIEDSIKDIDRDETKFYTTIIGGNQVKWYGGISSLNVARSIDCLITAPSMGRRIKNEECIRELNHIPYLRWDKWMYQLTHYRYAVHMMPVVAAGTFSLNCAFLGLPTIGNELVDTQRLCHPELSVGVNEIGKAIILINRLHTDQGFYSECSAMAKENYEKYFSEKVFMKFVDKLTNRSKVE